MEGVELTLSSELRTCRKFGPVTKKGLIKVIGRANLGANCGRIFPKRVE
jgi:hypothetical protein